MSGAPVGEIARRRVDERGVAALVYDASDGSRASVIVMRTAGGYRAWRNRCPHWGVPLAPPRGPFLDETGERLRCLSHGALFRPEDGVCEDGPCPGASLEAFTVEECGEVLRIHEPSPVRLSASRGTVRLAVPGVGEEA